MRPGSNKIIVFELNIGTYGTSCASYLATQCLRTIAVNSPKLSLASKALLEDCYVDDVAKGFEQSKKPYSFIVK